MIGLQRYARQLRRPVIARLTCCAIVFLLASACSDTESPEVLTSDAHPVDLELSDLELFDRTLQLEDGTSLAYQRGTVGVPTRRDGTSNSTLSVEFFRFYGTSEAARATPPIVLLHGGPGFEGLGPRLEQPGYFEARLARYTRIADVVVPGQRGFGSSGSTPCDPLPELSVEQAVNPEFRKQAIQVATAMCLETWRARGVEVSGLHAAEAATDVADIVRGLGYEKVQLRGISFGSHWAMAILSKHAELVERATLSALEGPDHTYSRPSQILATLEKIAAAAEASPEYADRTPAEGIIEAYRRLIAGAATQPLVVEAEHPHTGELITLELDDHDLRQIFAGARRHTQFRFRMDHWPAELLEMLEGDFRQAAEGHLWNLLDQDLDSAAYVQYECASGMSRSRRRLIDNDPAVDLFGRAWRRLDTVCQATDVDLGEAFRTNFTTTVPSVLVQGTWDTSTPFENAEELRPSFATHHFVRVEGGSHGAIREALEEVDGFESAMDHWLATGDAAKIPGSVSLPPKWPTPPAQARAQPTVGDAETGE